MALSKWFLCGSEGDFDKDEPLAQNAAGRGLPSAEFATGYYEEIGVGCAKNLEVARKWYTVAAQHGNEDARERLQALSQPQPASLSRQQHENITDAQLVRKRTLARERSRGTRYPPSAPATYNDPAEIRDTDAIRKDRSPGPRAAPGFPNAAPVRGYSPSQQRIPSVGVIPTGRAPPGMSGPATAQRDGRGRPPTDAPRYNPHTAQIPAQAPSGGPSRLEPLRRDNIPTAARPPLPKSGPQTFEEMGFRSQKLEDKECVIM
ncbi:hypothetical protein B0H21DRAFT_736937 [Amylocystis lapponica]|nr:hypothetical protein B0H21DRAFT_736937 [Amylocystis lapponica]